MNYIVIPDDLQAFGNRLTTEFGPRAATILANVKAAKAPVNYFGVIPQLINTFSPYDDMHNALVKHAELILENVQHAADRFNEAATAYANSDAHGRQQMDQLSDDLYEKQSSTNLDPNSAPKPAAPDGALSDTANDYYEKPGQRTGYGDRVDNSLPGFAGSLTKLIKDWKDADDPDGPEIAALASDGYGVVENAMLETMVFLSDPLGFLISNGLGFVLKICTPLKQLIDTVGTGNPDGLKSCSALYADIAKDLERLATDLVGAAKTGIPRWHGTAATAASAKVDAFVKGVHGTAAVAGDAAGVLQLFAVLSQALEDIVLGLIGDFVENIIAVWLTALAAEVPTAGASTAAAVTTTEVAVGHTATKAGKSVDEVTSLFKRLKALCDKLGRRLMQNDKLRNGFQNGAIATTERITGKEMLKEAGKRTVGLDGTAMPSFKRASGGGVTPDGTKKYVDPAKLADKGTGYVKTGATTAEDFSTGTDESDEEVDQQLNFGQ